MSKGVSVVIPAYNEQDNVAKCLTSVSSVIKKLKLDAEVIVVDDGSTDQTGEIARKFIKKIPNLKIVTNHPNRGYGAAFKSGFYNASLPWIAFIDADGQFDFSEISHFLETQKNTDADLVIGYYLGRKVSALRKLNSFLWQVVVFILFGLRVKDIDCGFKLVSKKVIDTIPRLESERGAFISSEFLIKVRKSGFKIVQIGVNHYPRKQGEATGAKLNVIIRSFLDLFSLWTKLR